MRTVLFLVALLTAAALSGQGALLQGWYWDYPKADGADAWAERLRREADGLGAAGFSHVWLPPFTRASSGQNSNGYDPQDLYDLGEFGRGRTGFGTRAQVDAAIAALRGAGVSPVADVVYNHRDGGDPEVNPALKAYVETHYDARKQPFPSDRFDVRLPLGGNSGNGAGTYYFKLSSKTADARFHGAEYNLKFTTGVRTGFSGRARENEPNGGGDCGQPSQALQLARELRGNVDDPGTGCGTDEFEVTLGATDFDPAGDYLYVSLTNTNGNYADQRFYGIWNAAAQRDVVGELEYVTRTDYTSMPSGRGAMDFENFRPNSTTASGTFLSGDYEFPFFFSDYDQANPDTRRVLTEWTDWLFDEVNIGGLRMDAVKHFDPSYLGELLLHLEATGNAPSLYVGEFFDGNPTALANWVRGVANAAPNAQTPVSAFDFALRDALKEACDNGFYDVRNVFNSGLVDGGTGLSGFNAVTFINNHDFRNPGEPVQNGANLAYAYLLTNNQIGLPSVYYPDYAGTDIVNAPQRNLSAEIDALLELQRTAIAGSSARTYLSEFNSGFGANVIEGRLDELLLYQLRNTPSGRDVIVAINFGETPLRVDHAIQTGGDIQTGTRFTDELGRSNFPVATVDADGRLYFDLPARSYSVWREEGVQLPVDLTRFAAVADGAANDIVWSVANEIDFDRYELERATSSAPDAYETIASISARGTSGSETIDYSWTDATPAAVSYYRLRMVDTDGSEAYSDVVVVRRTASAAALRLSPNPIANGRNSVRVTVAPSPAARELTVVDGLGRVVLRETVEPGVGAYDLSVSVLPAGLYAVSIGTEVARLVVE